jgi:hypothetical protein
MLSALVLASVALSALADGDGELVDLQRAFILAKTLNQPEILADAMMELKREQQAKFLDGILSKVRAGAPSLLHGVVEAYFENHLSKESAITPSTSKLALLEIVLALVPENELIAIDIVVDMSINDWMNSRKFLDLYDQQRRRPDQGWKKCPGENPEKDKEIVIAAGASHILVRDEHMLPRISGMVQNPDLTGDPQEITIGFLVDDLSKVPEETREFNKDNEAELNYVEVRSPFLWKPISKP